MTRSYRMAEPQDGRSLGLWRTLRRTADQPPWIPILSRTSMSRSNVCCWDLLHDWAYLLQQIAYSNYYTVWIIKVSCKQHPTPGSITSFLCHLGSDTFLGLSVTICEKRGSVTWFPKSLLFCSSIFWKVGSYLWEQKSTKYFTKYPQISILITW